MITLLTSALASGVRGGKGLSAIVRLEQPAKLLEFYDIEGCPYCRPVREALTQLDLDVLIYPCPKGSNHYWDRLTALGGKSQVPFLYDPNTSRYLYDARQIIDYLFQTYMPEKTLRAPQNLGLRQSQLATALRLKAGLKAHQNSSAAKAVVQPLELFSFEASPFSRLVREKLSELSLAYVLRNSGKQQLADQGLPWLRPNLGTYQPIARTKRAELLARTGKVQFPYLYDPNTDTGLFESKAIIRYLEQQYT